MNSSERTIILDIDDLEEIDDWGNTPEWATTYGPSQGLIYRAFRAIYDARPPEPKTVTVDGTTYTWSTNAHWYISDPRIPVGADFGAVLTSLWELGHPDEEADR